jgi:hypothetical protein
VLAQRVLALLAGTVLLAGCGAAGQDQTVADYGIAYIKRPIPTEIRQDTTDVIDPVESDVREATAFNAGGDVYFRDRASPSATERNLTFCITGGVGDVKDLEASYDGTKLIFSLREEDPDPDDDFIPKWNIYEYDTTVGGCPTPVLPPSSSLAEEGNSVAPAYLPDGRIVFSSSLARATGAVLLDEGHSRFQPLDESQNEPALVLHVMNADGTDIKQISFNQSHDLDPTVMANGEILFSRWDHMGSRNAINLYKIRPDGTELAAVYGVHDHDVGTNGSTVQFLSPREMQDGRILAMLKPFTGSAGGGAPVLIDAANYADNNQPTWPNMGVLSGPGQVSAIDLDVRTDGSISPAGRFRSVYPLWDGTNRALVSWSQCRLRPTDPETGLPIPGADPEPCPDTIPANAEAAFPLYGIYIYDIDQNTQLPVVVPEEGVMIDEPVVLAPRDRPTVLFDKSPGFELDLDLSKEDDIGVGVLDIRSVYDFDGSYNALGGSAPSLADMANPMVTDADQRPARFLRIVKAVSIPDTDVYNFDDTAFGRSRQQKMREIIGYAPIEPDGSVMTKVPPNVPLAISVVDKDGRRIGPRNLSPRHQNWIQLSPGETLQCNGCHDHRPPAPAVPLPHGYREGPPALNRGAQVTVPNWTFPGTTTDDPLTTMVDETVYPQDGETMAEARIRNLCGSNLTKANCPELSPSVNPDFTDFWANGFIPNVLDRRYSDLTLTDLPTTGGCQTNWSPRCRIVINYETHIHPLWSLDRGANTCTNDGCHSTQGDTVVPAGTRQLDLSDGDSTDEPKHFKSYRELLFQDFEQEVVGGTLTEKTVTVVVQETDADGNLVFETDPLTGELLLDSMGNPIPSMITREDPIPIAPPMSVNGSRAGIFMDTFLAGGFHEGLLTPAELRLIAEWLDIGAQYYNSPFDAPEN